MNKYDIVIIGAGPSGYAAAMRALDFKKKTLLIERNKVGGAGVTNGALSSKTWWELSRETAAFRKSLSRFNMTVPNVIYKEIQEEVRRGIHERKSMLEEHMERLKDSNYSDLLDFRIGTAKLLSSTEVEITNGVHRDVVQADNI